MPRQGLVGGLAVGLGGFTVADGGVPRGRSILDGGGGGGDHDGDVDTMPPPPSPPPKSQPRKSTKRSVMFGDLGADQRRGSFIPTAPRMPAPQRRPGPPLRPPDDEEVKDGTFFV